MNPTASTRRAQRKDRRGQERDDRWYAAASAAKWTDPDSEPPPSAWGRWTPPKRWRERHADIMRFTRGQIAFIAGLFNKAFGGIGPDIVATTMMDGPPVVEWSGARAVPSPPGIPTDVDVPEGET